jgi:hypothetical protein
MCTHTHTHKHTLNVRSPTESNWPDDGSRAAETCCLLYFNKLYVSVVFRRHVLFIIFSNSTRWLLSKHETKFCMISTLHRLLHLVSDWNKVGRHRRTWSKNTMSQPGGVIIAVVRCSGPYVTPSLTHTQETELLFHEIIKRATVLLSWCQSERRVLI